MYRIVDNTDGSILAIVFSETLANKILEVLPKDEMEPGISRFAWEDCFQHPTEMIGDTLTQLGRAIQLRKP